MVPANASLTSLLATAAPGSSVAGGGGGGSNTGTLRGDITAPAFQISGCTASHDDVARLMSRLRLINGVQRVTLSDSVKPSAAGYLGDRRARARGASAGCTGSRPTSTSSCSSSPWPVRPLPRSGGAALTGGSASRAGHPDAVGAAGRPRAASTTDHRRRATMTARDRTVLDRRAHPRRRSPAPGSWRIRPSALRRRSSRARSPRPSRSSTLPASTVAAGQAAKSQFASSYTTMARLGEAVPSDDEVPSLIFQVQSAATASRVDFGGSGARARRRRRRRAAGDRRRPGRPGTGALTTMPPGVTVGAAGFPTEPFTFTFTGNFFHLSDFFGRLQRFVTATNQRIRSADG